MKIMIGIKQKINLGGYESIEPSINMEFEIEGKNYEEEYNSCYKEVENLWNVHAFRLISGAIQRRKATSLTEWAKEVNKPEVINNILNKENENVRSK